MSELRFHPFLDQWVITATHRQDRTFLPPADFNPLAPTQPGGFPTEVPFPSYDIVVFENKFPSLRTPAAEAAVESGELYRVRPSDGVCEVVCYTQDPKGSMATMAYSQIRKLTRVWQDRYRELSARPEVDYVYIFENKGKEIGVTLEHPHGQIYGYPFVPPVLEIELEAERAHLAKTGRLLMADVLKEELGGPRVVWENETFVAFIPFFARYPYELYLTSKAHLRSLDEMSPAQLDDLAEALMVVTRKYDGLFGFSLPYIMAMHQQPAKVGFDFNWFHVEFYPPYRTANKLKYLAGSEAGAGAYINDTLPEATAQMLRDVAIGL